MNKLIIFSLLILSVNLFAQDEEPAFETEFSESPVDEPVVIPGASTEVAAKSETPVPSSVEPPAKPIPKEEYVETPSTNTPVISTRVFEERKKFNPREAHWLISFGGEGMAYENPFEFDGVRKNFKPGKQDLYGVRLGLGGEIHLAAGLMTTTKVEGYYLGTAFTKAKTADPEITKLEFASSKKEGSIWGIDASQAIGYIFDFKTKNPFLDEWAYLTFEPYVEAGIGMARARSRLNYIYDTESGGSSSPTTVLENYRHTVNDEIVNAKIGVGFNLTSTSGYFFYMKATQNRYDVTSRKHSGIYRQNGGAITPLDVPSTDKNVKIDPVTIYALGGGYKF